MQKTADISKISKSVLRDLTITFDVLSEYAINFLSNLVSLAVENVVSFTQNEFNFLWNMIGH